MVIYSWSVINLKNKRIFSFLLILAIITALLPSCALSSEIEVSSTQTEISTVNANYNISGTETSGQDSTQSLLEVNFVDVGQGDCILIKTPNEKTILIDSGSLGSKETVLNFIKKQGISEIEYAFFTHPHADHIGAADEILKKYTVKNVYMPNAVTTTQVFERMLDELEKHKEINIVQAKAGQSITVDEVKLDILSPIKDSYCNLNNYSIIIKMNFGDNSFLFTGDAEMLNEQEMLEANYNLDVDILKVGHHGSGSSTSSEFLAAVTPEAAIISCGAGNRYGHPHDKTLEKLKDIETYRTDKNGTITVYCSKTDFTIKTEH